MAEEGVVGDGGGGLYVVGLLVGRRSGGVGGSGLPELIAGLGDETQAPQGSRPRLRLRGTRRPGVSRYWKDAGSFTTTSVASKTLERTSATASTKVEPRHGAAGLAEPKRRLRPPARTAPVVSFI